MVPLKRAYAVLLVILVDLTKGLSSDPVHHSDSSRVNED